jgi:hypothetical protein
LLQGQTPIDIATKELVSVLEELKKNSKRTKRRPGSQIRISGSLENNVETPPKVIRVEVNPESKNTENCGKNYLILFRPIFYNLLFWNIFFFNYCCLLQKDDDLKSLESDNDSSCSFKESTESSSSSSSSSEIIGKT